MKNQHWLSTLLARETVSDSIDGKLPGSQDATAPQGIIVTDRSLILEVHCDTYEFPRSYAALEPQQLAELGQLHKKAKHAILNDGMDPAQLRALRDNRREYVAVERIRRQELIERKMWGWWY